MTNTSDMYQEFLDPTDLLMSHGITTVVNHDKLRETGIKIAKISYHESVFDMVLDLENNAAILVIPNEEFDAYFPLNMAMSDAIYYYFGEKHIDTDNECVYEPMSKASFCTITVE